MTTRFFKLNEHEKEQRRNEVQDWLAKPGNNFCAMPYAHMAIESNGSVRPCCMGEPFDYTVAGGTIDDALNHPIRKEFIDSFDRNEQHKNCDVCWKDPSNRFNARLKFSTNDDMIEYTEKVMNGAKPTRTLKWLEVKPGNRCSLKCRICGVHNSSQWTKDYWASAQYLSSENEGFVETKFKDSKEFKYTQSCEWIDEPDIWADVKSMEGIQMIHFMGGEPFMVPEHFQLLQALVDNPDIDTSQIYIRYNTNGTYFPTQENIDLWSKFLRVLFLLSVDDIEEKFEYQRKLAHWDQVKENLIKFKELQENSWDNHSEVWKVRAKIDPTISMFNIWNLQEISDEFHRLGHPVDKRMNHFVTGGWNDCRILPKPIKEIIADRAKDTKCSWVKQGISYMLQDPLPNKRHNITLFYKTMMYQDHLRDEKFVNLWPELYHLITPYVEWSKINQYHKYKETKYEQKNT